MSWRQAKIAALRGEVYTDYLEGMKYDGGRIPTSNFVQGYGHQDWSDMNANYWHESGVNLPADPQDLYDGCRNRTDGYRLWSQREIDIENAPIFIKSKQPGIGVVGDALRGAHVNAPFFSLPGTEQQATAIPITVRDVGNPIGTLTIGPLHPKQNPLVSYY